MRRTRAGPDFVSACMKLVRYGLSVLVDDVGVVDVVAFLAAGLSPLAGDGEVRFRELSAEGGSENNSWVTAAYVAGVGSELEGWDGLAEAVSSVSAEDDVGSVSMDIISELEGGETKPQFLPRIPARAEPVVTRGVGEGIP